MKTTLIVVGIVIIAISVMLFAKACNLANNMINDGVKTTQKEFSPSMLLKKYEWFKDAVAQCDQKLATLNMYTSRFSSMKSSYNNESRSKWSREDKEQWNVWESEYLGVKASYNDLASQYNANMAKFNYAFCNVGQLPAGATEPLPREFKPYLNN